MNTHTAFLYSLQRFGMKFGLRNIRRLLRSLNDPHKEFHSVHVAGTNGKGSTSSMIAAILTAAGYRVGLYTSPHLVRFNERIRINGRMISNRDLAIYTRLLRPEIERNNATFFEATTAIAFKYFADKRIDIAVIETGLGGRLDATNVLTPLVSVITSIGKDHLEQLGRTLPLIAAEKAGIIKRNVPVVIGPMNASVRAVLRSTAQQRHSSWIDASRIELPYGSSVELRGTHQTMNARCAVAAVNIVSSTFVVGDRAVRDGLAETVRFSGLRARQEYLNTRPRILLDAGHNAEGIKTLVDELKKGPNKRIVIILGLMKDKDHISVLQHIRTLSPYVVATQPAGERAQSSSILANACSDLGIKYRLTNETRTALRVGRTIAGKKGLLVITGSHYLIGELLPLLEKNS